MNSFIADLDLEFFLEKVPLFSSTPKSEIKKIADCFRALQLKKDTIVFEQDDPSDAMYIIRSGAVIVESEIESQKYRTELHRGDFFGEMALLSELPRNAMARTSLDTILFKLNRNDFHSLIKSNKQIGLFLSRLYARRLSVGYQGGKTVKRQTSFYSVSASEAGLGLSHFLYTVSYHISTESKNKVLVVEPHLELSHVMKNYGLITTSCPDETLFSLLPSQLYQEKDFLWYRHPAGFFVLQVNKGFSPNLVPALSSLMEGFKRVYDTVFFSLSHYMGALEKEAIRLCDKNLLLINNTEAAFDSVKTRLDAIEAHSGAGFDRVRVGVSHLCGTHGIARERLKQKLNLSETPQIWVDRYDKALKNQIDTKKHFPIRAARAVAREIAGVRVGLALGAGAARGWAHIGVLKVLQENDIQIDMISGTSMGALVGAIFAARGDVNHLKKNTIDRFPNWIKARTGIFDYTLPFKGLLKGNKAMKLVAQSVNDADFMDLMIPTYLTSVDIIRGEEVLLEAGDVATAVRASLSIPGIFTPVNHLGRWMVDGGLLNPVPVNILEQKGADKIISVCIENPYSHQNIGEKTPGLLEVIARTIRIVHQQATNGFAHKSDIVIYPDVQGVSWDQFHKGEELMLKGVQACEAIISDMKQVINS